LRMFTLVDEYTRECLAIDVARRLTSEDVLERLTDLFIRRGVPDYIRSDNGAEFTSKAVRDWLAQVGVRTLFIEPGSPWENGYCESFNGKLRDELLAREIFYTLLEAKVLAKRWREDYNRIRPHSALGYRPPAPEGVLIGLAAAGSAPLVGEVANDTDALWGNAFSVDASPKIGEPDSLFDPDGTPGAEIGRRRRSVRPEK